MVAVRYEVAVGTAMGGSDVAGWIDVGDTSTYTVRDGVDGIVIELEPARDYYLSARAVDYEGRVLGVGSSRAWYVFEPYVFDIERFGSVTRDAPDSFWGIRHPDPRYAEFDERFEAYVVGSGALGLYTRLTGKVLTGYPELRILQTERGYPVRGDVVWLGEGAGDSGHAGTVASMLYDCEFKERRQSYYRGCQANPLKFAMTSGELGERLQEFVLTSSNASEFEVAIFGAAGAPDGWSMPHAHPTSVQRSGNFDRDQVTGLRLGDWMVDRFNILGVSPQPGSYAGRENPTLSGNYYNTIVVGKKSYNYTYAAQSSIDNADGLRHKPDIVVSTSNLAEASSWSVATLAAAASGLLGLAHADPLLGGATHTEAMKAIILAGAGKDFLCPKSIAEIEGFCNALPTE